jgi:nicotinamide-nucleotide amidase
MTSIILSIGDELVLGQTIDTNSAWLSRQLAAVGCAVLAHMTVADDQAAIEQAIRDAAGRCDYLIVSGGIGPTADDLTRQALAAVMNVPLELNESWLAKLHDFFQSRGRPMPEINKIQAMIPRGAKMIENTCGTAAGIEAVLSASRGPAPCPSPGTPPAPSPGTPGEGWGEGSAHSTFPSLSCQSRQAPHPALSPEYRGEGKHCTIFVVPGVPKEMMAMFTRDILPVIKQSGGGAVILSKTLHTFGLGESAVAEMLGELMDRRRNPSVGTTVSGGIVSLRINARYNDPATAQRELEKTEAECRAALGDLIFGADEQMLPAVVADMLRRDPVATKWSPAVATAESCTGGLLAKMLTDIPGSSAYFRQGYITYSNEAKTDLLNVPRELIAQHGAVSEPVAEAMARGCQEQSGAAYCLAITGIAGPDGGTPTKPVGTVCIALAAPVPPHSSLITHHSSLARTFHLFGDREMVRDRAAKMALTMLRFHLLGKPMPF